MTRKVGWVSEAAGRGGWDVIPRNFNYVQDYWGSVNL